MCFVYYENLFKFELVKTKKTGIFPNLLFIFIRFNQNYSQYLILTLTWNGMYNVIYIIFCCFIYHIGNGNLTQHVHLHNEY